jgi:hypothetical protein
MAVFTSMARTKGEFKDLILDNLFVITKNAAQLFDNVYRENTNALADDLGHTFELLIRKIDHKEAMSIPEPLWFAYMLLWQAANTLVAGYQSIRVGFPVEAIVIARHAMEMQALALAFFLEPENFTEYQKGNLKATDCISRVKGLYPEFGRQYGILSEIAHPSAKFFPTHLQKDGDNAILLIGAGLPDGKPRLIRAAVTRMLIQVIELQSALLHASVELISLDEVAEPNYWRKAPGGILWDPSIVVRERWARRSEELQKLLEESS